MEIVKKLKVCHSVKKSFLFLLLAGFLFCPSLRAQDQADPSTNPEANQNQTPVKSLEPESKQTSPQLSAENPAQNIVTHQAAVRRYAINGSRLNSFYQGALSPGSAEEPDPGYEMQKERKDKNSGEQNPSQGPNRSTNLREDFSLRGLDALQKKRQKQISESGLKFKKNDAENENPAQAETQPEALTDTKKLLVLPDELADQKGLKKKKQDTETIDQDGDGIPDEQDGDIDGDGIPNEEDLDSTVEVKAKAQPEQFQDTDGDGLPDGQDPDIDGDGIPNASDPDANGDGILDQKTKDTDGDGVPDLQDPDIDGDGIPNPQDADADGDGVLDKKE